MKVEATATGYINHLRRREGDVFTIPDQPLRVLSEQEKQDPALAAIADKSGRVPKAFSSRWMKPVAQATPERVSTSQQEINRKHDLVLAERAGAVKEQDGAARNQEVI